MEGASMMFHGDYKKRCLLTIMVSQILLLIKLISEIKYYPCHKDFSLKSVTLHWNIKVCHGGTLWLIGPRNKLQRK
jgi:hypothetical protein